MTKVEKNKYQDGIYYTIFADLVFRFRRLLNSEILFSRITGST